MSVKCYKCQTPLDLSLGSDLSRTEDCPSCRADLRCCKMCVFHDVSAYNECKEPTAERVLEKEKPNFCDFFKVRNGQQTVNVKENALAELSALFKK